MTKPRPSEAAATRDKAENQACPELPGLDLPKVWNGDNTREVCNDRDVLVVGSSNDAVAVALDLATEHGNRVWLSSMSSDLHALDPAVSNRLQDALREHLLVLNLNSQLRSVSQERAVLEVDEGEGEWLSLPNDLVYDFR